MGGKVMSDFELFKHTFLQYQKEWGLLEYNIYFENLPTGDNFASIAVANRSSTATVTFNSGPPEEFKSNNDINLDAKHEALHLLLARLTQYMPENEATYAAEEATVNRLCGLLPDVKTLEASTVTKQEIEPYELANK